MGQKYRGVPFGEIKEKLQPHLDKAWSIIDTLPVEVQGSVIGAGLDGNGAFIRVNITAPEEHKIILKDKLSDISSELRVEVTEIPHLH